MDISPIYQELDPKKKDKEWGNRMITDLRMRWMPLLDQVRARRNKDWLFGRLNMEFVRAMFKDPDNAQVNFNPQKVLEKIRNIMTSEIIDEDIEVDVNAIDPTAKNEKEDDAEMLAHRSETEELLSYLRQGIGMPAYSLKDEKNLSGKDKFNGNIDKFDQLGLEEGDDEDRNHFLSTYYRLPYEEAADSVIRAYNRQNEVRTNLPKWANDVIANRCVAMKVYLNQTSGNIQEEYLEPETIWAIPGSRLDYKDAICLGYENQVTVMQLINALGDEFDIIRDWNLLLNAINVCNNMNYNCIGYSAENITCGTYTDKGSMCTWSQMYAMKVTLGYIEFKSLNSKEYIFNKNKLGRLNILNNPNYKQVNRKPEYYVRKQMYQQCTYKAYYLQTGALTQTLFDWGKLSYQQTEGVEDEISNGSIIVIQEQGPSIVEVAEPHLRIFYKAAAKHEYMINKAKESGYMIDFDSLVAIAAELVEQGQNVTPMDILKLYETGPNQLFKRMDGVGGNGVPNIELKNGISASVIEFRNIMVNCINDINDQLGISPLREAYAPNARDSVSLQLQSLEQSRKATKYVSNMLGQMFANTATRVLGIAQDVIAFKKYNPLPYKFMTRLLGDFTVNQIASLGAVALHRFNVYVEPFNRKFDRQEQKLYAQQAFNNKEISFDQMIAMDAIDSPKKAAMQLAYEKRKAEKKAREAVKFASELQDQNAQKEHERKMEEIQLKGQFDVQQEEVRGQWYYKALTGAAEVRAEEKAVSHDQNIEKTILKTDETIRGKEAMQNIEAQKPTVE